MFSAICLRFWALLSSLLASLSGASWQVGGKLPPDPHPRPMFYLLRNPMAEYPPSSHTFSAEVGRVWGAWVAQWVKCTTLDLSSGLELRW